MVLDNQGQLESRWVAILSISAKIVCAPQTLNKWVKKAEVDRGELPDVTTDHPVFSWRAAFGTIGAVLEATFR